MHLAEKELRIALLIDADNAPSAKIDKILTELSTLGVINVRRAYGNWIKPGLGGWQEKLLEYAIRPIQQFDYSTRKNATDMAMTVDAMELLYADRPDAFGIVSSDADFTPLVMHLRSKGAAVYGFGAAHTPKPFVNACSRFLYLEALGAPLVTAAQEDADSEGATAVSLLPESPLAAEPPGRPVALRVPTSQLRQDTKLLNLLRDAVNASRDEDGWAKVGAVGTQIANKTSFDARNYGYATLSKLLAATDLFELREEGTPRIAVRDKRQKDPVPALPKVLLPSPTVRITTPDMLPSAGNSAPRILATTFARESQTLIVRPGMHAVRATLSALALHRVSIADILLAVPELATGHSYALSGVYGRLRESGVLRPSASGLRLFQRYPRSFRLVSRDAQMVAVRYIG